MTGSGDGPVTQGGWGRTRLPQTVAAPASGSAPGTAWTSPPTPEQVHAVATGVVAQVPGPGAPQPTITARVEPVAPPAPPVRLVYDGKLGELYVIYLRSLILTLLSFGFYRFWGRTRVRRYLWSHFSAFGDRFEYRGLGVELFLGFLSVVGVLLVFVLPSSVVMSRHAFGGWPAGLSFLLLSGATAGCAVAGVVQARRRRYDRHRRWMLRCYVLICSAVALRLISGAARLIGVPSPEQAYIVAAWVSWLFPLAAFEVAERWRAPTARGRRASAA